MSQTVFWDQLNDLYRSAVSRLVLIPGKPGAGKTSFLKKWVQDKSSLYFRCDLQHDRIQIPRFSTALQIHYPKSPEDYESWESLLDHLFQLSTKDNKLIIIFDEFPKLLKSNREMLVFIENAWKNKKEKYPFMFIICGSSLPEMKYSFLRLSGAKKGDSSVIQMPFPSLNFEGFQKQFSSLKIADAVALYGVTGGNERFLSHLQQEKTVKDNVQHFFDPGNFVYFDPKNLFCYDFHDPATYFSILQVLAHQDQKIGNIAKYLQLKTHNLTSFLDRLRDLEIIQRILPPTDEYPDSSRKGRYHIIDHFHRFWFRYIYPHQDILSTGNIDYVWSFFQSHFNQHMKETIMGIIKEKLNNNPFFPVKTAGPWWNKNTSIDLVALGQKDALFCWVHFDDKPMSKSIHRQLQESIDKVIIPQRIKKTHLLFFSNKKYDASFTSSIHQKKNVYFWGFDDLA